MQLFGSDDLGWNDGDEKMLYVVSLLVLDFSFPVTSDTPFLPFLRWMDFEEDFKARSSKKLPSA